MRYRRHLARDRLLASLHEAAHVVIARHLDVGAQAYLVPTGAMDIASSKTVVGSCCMSETSDAGVMARIAVAGAVGESIRRNDADEYDTVHSRMSDTDCRLCDIPTENEVLPEWASDDPEAQHIRDAIDEVGSLLNGPLRSQWLTHARELRIKARAVMAKAMQLELA